MVETHGRLNRLCVGFTERQWAWVRRKTKEDVGPTAVFACWSPQKTSWATAAPGVHSRRTGKVYNADTMRSANLTTAMEREAQAGRVSRPRDQLDRQILVLSVCLWATHLAFMISRDFPDGPFGDLGSTLARLITAVSAIAMSMAIHAFLKRLSARASLGVLFRALALSAPACLLVTVINEFSFSRLSTYYLTHPGTFPSWRELFFTFNFFLWIFVAWAALYTTLSKAEELREQERRVAAATSAAHIAQLKALQLQIHPHFLFNTLNTLSGLVGKGRVDEAERTIINLSTFLRHTLRASPDQFVTLAAELEVQRMYLDIETVRFAERLKIAYAVDDDCLVAMTPSLILQPLVENAVKHCLSQSEEPVKLTIGARRQGETLQLWVTDERNSEGGQSVPGTGIGLANVRERLEALFGAEGRLGTQRNANGWTASVTHPWIVRP